MKSCVIRLDSVILPRRLRLDNSIAFRERFLLLDFAFKKDDRIFTPASQAGFYVPFV